MFETFLGFQKQKKNKAFPTTQDAPQKMLERNNGIVLRADRVVEGEAEHQLKLSKGSVATAVDDIKCLLCCKDCSKRRFLGHSANYQNEIAYIDRS